MAACYVVAALLAAAVPAVVAGPVIRQYIGVIGAHDSVEVTLTFDGGAVSGAYRMADGGPEGRLQGVLEAGRLELRATGADGSPAALLTAPVPRDGLLRGQWRAEGGERLSFYAEEVANDLPAAQSFNGHYVRQGSGSGGSLDLLLLDGDRVKAQGHASWAGPVGGAASGEVAGWAVFDGRSVRLEARPGCLLVIAPVEGGLEVSQQGRCPANFAGRYERRSGAVPDWETFRWVGE